MHASTPTKIFPLSLLANAITVFLMLSVGKFSFVLNGFALTICGDFLSIVEGGGFLLC